MAKKKGLGLVLVYQMQLSTGRFTSLCMMSEVHSQCCLIASIITWCMSQKSIEDHCTIKDGKNYWTPMKGTLKDLYGLCKCSWLFVLIFFNWLKISKNPPPAWDTLHKHLSEAGAPSWHTKLSTSCLLPLLHLYLDVAVVASVLGGISNQRFTFIYLNI